MLLRSQLQMSVAALSLAFVQHLDFVIVFQDMRGLPAPTPLLNSLLSHLTLNLKSVISMQTLECSLMKKFW